MFPSIEPSDVGTTGLIWLLLSYGYVLYIAANLIGEGSELLLLVPSMAGLVGGVVLPLLGAIPDGAIILFSGLSPNLAEAQETVSIGVGALAGSTIMLLTIPLGLSIIIGRVDLLNEPLYDNANYSGKPKLTVSFQSSSIHTTMKSTGVGIHDSVKQGSMFMAFTTIPYFMIQIPAFFIVRKNNDNNNNDDQVDIGKAEKIWSLFGFIVCCIGLVWYMKKQLQDSQQGQDRDYRIALMKKVLKEGKMSLSGILASEIDYVEAAETNACSGDLIEIETNMDGTTTINFHPMNTTTTNGTTTTTTTTEPNSNHNGTTTTRSCSSNNATSSATASSNPIQYPSIKVRALLSDIIKDVYAAYDTNGDGMLDVKESYLFFYDYFHEHTMTVTEMNRLFQQYDTDQSGSIDYNEFINLTYSLIKNQQQKEEDQLLNPSHNHHNNNNEEGILSLQIPLMTQQQESTNGVPVVGRREVGAGDDDNNDDEEEENEHEHDEIPEEFTHLSPAEQQRAIKQRAFFMLVLGTALVLIFSDPMVDVFSEIGVRTNISSFYISFVLAPLASNVSEVVSTLYYATKKTRKTITVSFTALIGAACMNNTFCLSIFMSLIFFRGISWHYTAETIVIVFIQMIVCCILRYNPTLSYYSAIGILCLFPLSIVLVAGLESIGLD